MAAAGNGRCKCRTSIRNLQFRAKISFFLLKTALELAENG